MKKMKMNIKKVWPIAAIIVSVIGIGLLRLGPGLFSRTQNGNYLEINGEYLAVVDLDYLYHQAQRVNTLLSREEIYRQRLTTSRETLLAWEQSFWTGAPEQATVDLVAVVEKMATAAGLVVTNKALHSSLNGSAMEGWHRIGVTLEGRTGYPELITFFNALLASPKTLFVKAIDLRLDEYTGILRFRIRLYSYTR